MAIRIRDYRPLADAAAVLALWERALGDKYPIAERAFRPRAVSSPVFEPGDGVVAVDGRRVVGFALAEIGRHALGTGTGASVAAIMVDPACQRQGIGTRLLQAVETRLRAAGCKTAQPGAGAYRFWTGIPEDLPGARAFFERHGYSHRGRTPDMTIPLGNYTVTAPYQRQLEQAGARVVNCTSEWLGPLFTFQQREFAGWVPIVLSLLNAGDMDNILLVVRGTEVIGSINSYTPASRWRGANLVWERVFGERLGGYGAVGIAEAWRGKGLGAVMSQAAAVHVQAHGADVCYIDWVGPADFYGRLGARVWRWFDQFNKVL